MWITRTAIAHPVFATMVMIALTVVGLFSSLQLGVEAMPDVKLPMVTVNVAYPGASPEQAENDVAKPIENAVNTIAGVKTIRSFSTEGQNSTFIEFRLDADVSRAVQDVRDKVSQVRPNFPRAVLEPVISRVDTDNDQPIAYYALSADLRSQRELTLLAQQLVQKGLERVAGVGKVVLAGTATRQIQVRVDPVRLAAVGLGVDQVVTALRNENLSVPVGRLVNERSEVIVRVDGRIREPADFAQIVVARRGNAAIRLGQVATIADGEREPDSISRVNGRPAVAVMVYKAQDANVVSTGRGVQEAAEALRQQLPAGVELRLLYAMSDWVEQSVQNVQHTILEGGLLTVLIVFVFLGSWRSTVITGLTLPIAVIASLSAIYALGFTLNYMTLMALSLCIGLLIDDAIVVRENIVRHMRMGKPPVQAAREGTEEVGLAVLATTLSIVAVFVPIAFMKGIVGKFFYAFGITVAVSVLLSLFVSFTLDPMLSAVWRDPHADPARLPVVGPLLGAFERGFARLRAAYSALLGWCLAHRKTTLAVALATFALALPLFGVVGTEFAPQTDESYLGLQLTLPVGSSLAYAQERVHQVEEQLGRLPEIDALNTQIGTDKGHNTAQIDVILVDPSKRKRSQFEVEAQIRKLIAAIPGVQSEVGNGNGPPIWINLLGNNDQQMAQVMGSLRHKVEQVRGARDVDTSLRDGTPTVAVRLQPDLAAEVGLTNAQVGDALRTFVGGEISGYWLAPDGQNYEVVTQIPAALRGQASDVAGLGLVTGRTLADGAPEVLPLRALASIEPVSNPESIRRQNLQRRVALSAYVEGRPTGDVGKEVSELVKAEPLPPGLNFQINGEIERQQESTAAMGSVLLLAVIFIYIVLASQFGSFVQPVAIMASLPLSIVGVVLALLVTRTTLNIFSMIGIVFLMGLVTKNAILLVDFANRGQREGLPLEAALLEAGRIRLRPILMTTAAMIFGMLPLSIGLGQGAEQQAPMGRAIIGGVITSTLLTLVVVPVLYSYISAWENRRRERRRQAEARIDAGLEAEIEARSAAAAAPGALAGTPPAAAAPTA
jgi:hydrophobe/amphiphile efflux-1 (HAE1) family protein